MSGRRLPQYVISCRIREGMICLNEDKRRNVPTGNLTGDKTETRCSVM